MGQILNFDEVLNEELRCIEILRQRRGVRAKDADDEKGFGAKDADIYKEDEEETASESFNGTRTGEPDYDQIYSATAKAHYQQLVGLAFSGGGIRSATFNLGILQSLAQAGLLRHFDYLSTVSGGGYIGSWLIAWIKRNSDTVAEGEAWSQHEKEKGHAQDFDKSPPKQREVRVSLVERQLAWEHGENPAKIWPRWAQGYDDAILPIGALRYYGNYLTRHSLLSLETLRTGLLFAFNIILNGVILAGFLTCILLLPRLFVAAVLFLYNADPAWWNHRNLLLGVIAAALALIAWVTARSFDQDRSQRVLTEQGIFYTVALPVFLVLVLSVYWLLSGSDVKSSLVGAEEEYRKFFVGGGIVLLFFWVMFACLLWAYEGARGFEALGFGIYASPNARIAGVLAPLAAFLAGAIGGMLLCWLLQLLAGGDLKSVNWLKVSIWAPPSAVLSLFVAGAIFVVLRVKIASGTEQDKFFHIGGSVAALALTWLGLFVIIFYLPVTLRSLWQVLPEIVRTLGLGSMVAAVAALLLGQNSRRWIRFIGKVALILVIIGFPTFVALGVDAFLPVLLGVEIRPTVIKDDAILQYFAKAHQSELYWTSKWLGAHFTSLVLIFLVLVAVTTLLTWLVDVNEFSMNKFYRDRLTRAYLGASRNREPDLATGFDPNDDLDLTTLLDCTGCERCHYGSDALHGNGYDGPYPIFNAAIVSHRGGSRAFFFSPLHYGFTFNYINDFGDRYRHLRGLPISTADGHRFSIGRAMAISGAAVNPFRGYPKSRLLAAFLTFFSARLGVWIGNPAHPKTWHRTTPVFSLSALLSELLHGAPSKSEKFLTGSTGFDSKWISVADGGFVDNLGVVELVRRRCRFILASDAEADPEMQFKSLGNAIRRCRTELGVEIYLGSLDPLKPHDGSSFSRWHCAVGTIRYDLVDERAPNGVLIYIKSTLTGDEPADVLNYQREHKDFPHETTADQWFDDSQFECYRRLGQHIGNVVFGAIKGAGSNVEEVFNGLRRAWYPPHKVEVPSLTRLSERLDGIFERIRTDPDLTELHREIYQDIPGLTDTILSHASLPQADHPGAGTRDLRKGFYFCNSLILFMEDVYHTLQLEEEFQHPDNRGWLNLFRHWANSDTFRLTWAVAASTYGLRFQDFCHRRLSLSLGVTDLVSVWDENFSDEKNPLDAALAKDFDNVEERLIELLMISSVRGVRNPIAGRVKQILLARLLVPSNRAAERLEIGRRALTPGERADNLLSMNIGIVVITRKEDFESAALLTLAIRRQLSDLGLGRQVIHDVVCRLGVKKCEVPSDDDMHQIGLPTGSRESVQNLFRSVVNEVDLREARGRQMSPAGEDDASAIFGTMPTLPYSGVVRPPGATWAHAVGFCFWLLAGADGVSGTEIDAVKDALNAWAGDRVEKIETDSIAVESMHWYLNAKRPVEALEPEVDTFIRQLSKQPWFRGKYQKRFAIGLKNVAIADKIISDFEKKLICKIVEELGLSTSESFRSYLTGFYASDGDSESDD